MLFIIEILLQLALEVRFGLVDLVGAPNIFYYRGSVPVYVLGPEIQMVG